MFFHTFFLALPVGAFVTLSIRVECLYGMTSEYANWNNSVKYQLKGLP